MREYGVVLGDREALYWHRPAGSTQVLLADDQGLWQFIWENREHVTGFAHSHPGSGVPGPSYEDLTTFAAIEAALGRRLYWWITSANAVSCFQWKGPNRFEYEGVNVTEHLPWLDELRFKSEFKHILVIPMIEEKYHGVGRRNKRLMLKFWKMYGNGQSLKEWARKAKVGDIAKVWIESKECGHG